MGDISVHALDGVDLKINQGEFVCHHGAIRFRQEYPDAHPRMPLQADLGQYILDGEIVSELDKVDLAIIRNKKIGFIFQSYNLLPRTTALRNVILPLMYDRDSELDIFDMEDKAYEMLELVGLGDRVDHQPQELSGGQQQRVAVARALINDPVLIIADEPTGNLDSKSGEEIMNVLHTLHQSGATIVMVTHDPETAAHTERTIHLLDGKINQIHTNGHSKKSASDEPGGLQ